MDAETTIPRFPTAAAEALRLLPLPLVDALVSRLAQSAVDRHPSLFVRLGPHARTVFLIDPIDLPYALRLHPARTQRRVELVRRGQEGAWQARIAGPLAALLGLVHGAYDGDALFFSRDLTIEGDTEAVLALRNAIDDAEIDLSDEAMAMLGRLRTLAETPFRLLLPLVEQGSGVHFSRAASRAGARAGARG